VKRLIGQTYTFYVTLGEPLQQALSIRKFNRFLRDCQLVKDREEVRGDKDMIIACRDIADAQKLPGRCPPNVAMRNMDRSQTKSPVDRTSPGHSELTQRNLHDNKQGLDSGLVRGAGGTDQCSES